MSTGDDLTTFIVPEVKKNPEVLTFRIPKGLFSGKTLPLSLPVGSPVSKLITHRLKESGSIFGSDRGFSHYRYIRTGSQAQIISYFQGTCPWIKLTLTPFDADVKHAGNIIVLPLEKMRKTMRT